MTATVTVRDETTSGRSTREWSLDILSEKITVRDLIRSRVYQEVQDFNRSDRMQFRGLVQPADAETTLDGYTFKVPRAIDWERQFKQAVAAFELGRVLVLVDDRQVENLDDVVLIGPKTVVSFLRLVPLVGG